MRRPPAHCTSSTLRLAAPHPMHCAGVRGLSRGPGGCQGRRGQLRGVPAGDDRLGGQVREGLGGVLVGAFCDASSQDNAKPETASSPNIRGECRPLLSKGCRHRSAAPPPQPPPHPNATLPRGTHALLLRRTTCAACPVGEVGVQPSGNLGGTCEACTNPPSSIARGTCPAGAGRQRCAAGAECVACPPGTYALDSAERPIDTCVPCPRNTYKSGAGEFPPPSCSGAGRSAFNHFASLCARPPTNATQRRRRIVHALPRRQGVCGARRHIGGGLRRRAPARRDRVHPRGPRRQRRRAAERGGQGLRSRVRPTLRPGASGHQGQTTRNTI